MSNTVPLLPGIFAHGSGALWIEETRTVFVADVHLGYSWAQRRRGELGPLADTAAQKKLFALVDELKPEKIIFLGDLVHAPRPCAPEREWIESILTQLSQRAELVAIRGNHDRAFAREFGHLPLAKVETWSAPGLFAMHGDRISRMPIPETGTMIMGHLHPSFSLRDASGANQKVRLFLVTPRCVVLPAFSPFARGFDVACGIPAELSFCFGGTAVEAYAATGSRVASLGPLVQALQKMLAATPATPGHFRRAAQRRSFISNK